VFRVARSGWFVAGVATVGFVAGCGGAGGHGMSASAGRATTSTVAGTGTGSAPGRSACVVSPLRAFAGEPRIPSVERAAVTAVVAQLDRHPVDLHCATRTVTVRGPRVAPAGRADGLCLQAVNLLAILAHFPAPPPATTQSKAQYALQVVRGGEQRGRTLCIVP
jgi:hypothetical protein